MHYVNVSGVVRSCKSNFCIPAFSRHRVWVREVFNFYRLFVPLARAMFSVSSLSFAMTFSLRSPIHKQRAHFCRFVGWSRSPLRIKNSSSISRACTTLDRFYLCSTSIWHYRYELRNEINHLHPFRSKPSKKNTRNFLSLFFSSFSSKFKKYSFSVINFHIAFRFFFFFFSHTFIIFRCINSSVHDFTWSDGPILSTWQKISIKITLSFFQSKVYISVWMANTSVCERKHIRKPFRFSWIPDSMWSHSCDCLGPHRVPHMLTVQLKWWTTRILPFNFIHSVPFEFVTCSASLILNITNSSHIR